MRAPTKFREDVRCKNAIEVVPGGAAHSREDAPGFVLAKQRQVAARMDPCPSPRARGLQFRAVTPELASAQL